MGTAQLRGKVIVVTGAARSLGASICEAVESAGGTAVRTDIVEDVDPRVTHLDVTKEGDWGDAVAAIVAEHGHIDGLVNNAARYFGNRRLWDETNEEFRTLLEVNILGAWLGVQTVSRVMAQGDGGSIVNMSSTSGLTGALGFAGYGTTRWAVRGMTKFAASDLGRHGIRVNSLHPSGIRETGMLPPAADEQADRARDRLHPLGRQGSKVDVSNVATFLLSDESAFITGQEFVVDGGATLGVAT
jgi:3alpha(or 20beta)-hydroxysteroid dehydrogenase